MKTFVDFASRRLAEGASGNQILREWAIGDADFVESDHPRNDQGEFAEKGGGTVSHKERFDSFVLEMHKKYGEDIWGGKMSNEEIDRYQELEENRNDESRKESIERAKKIVEQEKSDKKESKADLPTKDVKSISSRKAKQYKENDIVPDGWYVHGRHGRQDLHTSHVVEMTKSWETAEGYAGGKGSEWMIKVPAKKDIFDARDEDDCLSLAKKMFKQYKNGELPIGVENLVKGTLQNTNGKTKEAMELIAKSFNPQSIVDSAEFWDSTTDELSWFYETTGKSFIITRDGAVMFPEEEKIVTVKVESEVRDAKEDIIEQSADNAGSLNKTFIGVVDFMDEKVKVFTINGQYARSPTGANVIEFTMGGNWYGGSKKDTYWPLCAEDEVVLHELMPPVDLLATLVHELVERWVMKNKGYDYDNAHTDFAEPMEKIARRVLETDEWTEKLAA